MGRPAKPTLEKIRAELMKMSDAELDEVELTIDILRECREAMAEKYTLKVGER